MLFPCHGCIICCRTRTVDAHLLESAVQFKHNKGDSDIILCINGDCRNTKLIQHTNYKSLIKNSKKKFFIFLASF